MKWKLAYLDQYIPPPQKALWDQDVHTLKDKRKFVATIYVSGAKAFSKIFYIHQDTEYVSYNPK